MTAGDWVQVVLAALGVAVAIAAIWVSVLPGRAVRKGEVARHALQLLEDVTTRPSSREAFTASLETASPDHRHLATRDELARAAKVAVDEFTRAAVRPGLSPMICVTITIGAGIYAATGLIFGASGQPMLAIEFVIIAGALFFFAVGAFIHRSWRTLRLAAVGIVLPGLRAEFRTVRDGFAILWAARRWRKAK